MLPLYGIIVELVYVVDLLSRTFFVLVRTRIRRKQEDELRLSGPRGERPAARGHRRGGGRRRIFWRERLGGRGGRGRRQQRGDAADGRVEEHVEEKR